MTTSTNGQICYGVLLEEDQELPWQTKEWWNDIDRWWLFAIQGYKNPFELFTAAGNWIEPKPTEEKRERYYAARYKFKEQCPSLPVELVNCCSCDCPIYILAIPSSMRSASRGSPEAFKPRDLDVSDDEMHALLEFCEEHGIDGEGPRWWLSSLWC